MRRRQLLAALLLGPASGGALLTGCHHAPKKEQVIHSLADDVMSVGIRDAVQSSHELQSAMARLAAAPSTAAVDAARAAWITTAVKWKRANAFREQLVVSGNELVRAAFWPPRPRGIDDLVRSDQSLADAEVDKLGADIRSLYAMEYLLFGEASGSPFPLTGAEGARAREALVAFAGSVTRCGESVEKALGQSSLATRLAALGQDSVNKLVGIAVGNIESLVANRLATIVWIGSTKRLRIIEVEGGPSGISHQLAATVVEVTEHLYRGEQGLGLGALVAAVAPAAHERIRGALAGALAAIHAFSEPLEKVALADSKRIDALVAKLKTLEVALRSDLASALGVTLTFTSADAD